MDAATKRKEAEYGKRALEYTANQLKIQGRQSKDPIFPTIKPGSTEWSVWERYFKEYLGFEPLAMIRARTNQQESMTVPTQMPEWFDSSYGEGKGGHYSPPQRPERPYDGPKVGSGQTYLEMTDHGRIRPHGRFEATNKRNQEDQKTARERLRVVKDGE